MSYARLWFALTEVCSTHASLVVMLVSSFTLSSDDVCKASRNLKPRVPQLRNPGGYGLWALPLLCRHWRRPSCFCCWTLPRPPPRGTICSRLWRSCSTEASMLDAVIRAPGVPSINAMETPVTKRKMKLGL